MMKKLVLFALTAALALSLAACGGEKAPETTPTPEPAPVPTETARPEDPAETEDPALRAKRLAAYQFALQQFAFEHVWPDGTEMLFDEGVGFIEENVFAITDLDRDGEDELLIRFTTSGMAGMAEFVYGYDAETDSIYEELCVFPNATYYDNGIVDNPASHNQGYAGDVLWPYTAYVYDAEQDIYVFAASVDAWSREYHPEGYPTEADPDNTGAVYYVTTERGVTPQPISKSAFEAWKTEFYGSAVQLELPLQSVSEENIAAVKD